MKKNTAISIENISKQYRLGLVGTGTISHDLKRWYTMNVRGKEDPFLKIGETNDRASKGESDYVWALKDINLEIEQGDVVGIIGKNGAGKSTLLKLLSRVTKPTTGSINYRGRIASLLEVGTGFHPEMTGRENIYMNGAIMGMTRKEISSKIDEIIAFAGIERYVDTPVKRYSSGMTVRLGFSIAAHLEPDILVVDEVLAVGDADFQKKAIGKMKDVSQGGGRTVLFVSHNMASIKSLCNKGVLLKNGMIKQVGDIDVIVSSYLKGDSNLVNYKNAINNLPLISLDDIDIWTLGIKAVDKKAEETITLADEILIEVIYFKKSKKNNIHLTFVFKDEIGNVIFTTGSGDSEGSSSEDGSFAISTIFPSYFFNWGSFFIDLYVIENKKNSLYIEKDILSFTIIDSKKEVGTWMGREPGPLHPNFKWIKIKN